MSWWRKTAEKTIKMLPAMCRRFFTRNTGQTAADVTDRFLREKQKQKKEAEEEAARNRRGPPVPPSMVFGLVLLIALSLAAGTSSFSVWSPMSYSETASEYVRVLEDKVLQAYREIAELKASLKESERMLSGRVGEPPACRVHNRCRFSDKQIVRLLETPDEIPEERTPHTVNLLVDSAKAGDQAETYIHCLHIKKTDKSRMKNEDPMEFETNSGRNEDDMNLNYQEKVEQLKELSSKLPDINDRITRSMAPNIWELHDVKKGLLCQFGGSAVNLPSGASFRGDINILMVGDPGTSKSQLLQYIHKLSPRGRGSSAIGLTAYVAKDPETGKTVLESGALVWIDRGTCCIDEFDKMSDSDRSMLHEVMEQQTVSIAKAGIIAFLNARTSVLLACANPSCSRYNPCLFDLIYLTLDKADVQIDRRLGKHIVALHFEDAETTQPETLDIATLTSCASYAREHIHPELSDVVEAMGLLEAAFQQSATDHATGTDTSIQPQETEIWRYKPDGGAIGPIPD